MTQLAFPILVATISLALARPRVGPFRINHAHAAGLGAFLTVATGAVSPQSLRDALGVLFLPVLTIVSLMVVTAVAERAGLFKLLAVTMAKAAAGNARRLLAYVFFAGTVAGTVFTNDAAVLIFTPLIFQLVEDVKGDSWDAAAKMPYYFAVLYVANLVGAFVISNPINLILASFFSIDFLEYAGWMALPAAVSVVVSYAGIRIMFRKDLPERYDWLAVRAPALNGRFAALTGLVLALTLAGFFMGHALGVPTWAIATVAALVLLVSSALTRQASVSEVVRSVGWDVIVFVCGVFVIVSGMREAGLTSQVQHFVTSLGGSGLFSLTMVNGFVAAISSALMNNHPTAYTMALAIEDMPLDALSGNQWLIKKMLVFSALIGGDLGPKMLPSGSLAALLWFRMLRQRGVEVPYALYVRIGIPVTLAAVLLSLLALYAEYPILARTR